MALFFQIIFINFVFILNLIFLLEAFLFQVLHISLTQDFKRKKKKDKKTLKINFNLCLYVFFFSFIFFSSRGRWGYMYSFLSNHLEFREHVRTYKAKLHEE